MIVIENKPYLKHFKCYSLDIQSEFENETKWIKEEQVLLINLQIVYGFDDLPRKKRDNEKICDCIKSVTDWKLYINNKDNHLPKSLTIRLKNPIKVVDDDFGYV